MEDTQWTKNLASQLKDFIDAEKAKATVEAVPV